MDDVKIYPDVVLGQDVTVGVYSVIGEPYREMPEGEATRIGDGAVIRSHAVIYAGNVIGAGFQSGHGVFLRECNTIGANVSIGTKTIVEHHVVIEDGVRIHSQAFIPEFSVLKRGAWVGPNVVLTNARYPGSPGAKDHLEGATIGEGAKVGANSTILPGVMVGRNSLVGAGSVVTKDVPDGAVVAGNPSRVIGAVSDLSAYEKRN